jgi:hypothetical protein
MSDYVSRNARRACASTFKALTPLSLLHPPWTIFRQIGVALYVILMFYSYSNPHHRPQRNDAYDPYGTFPLPHRPNNDTKDAFASAVQRTQ